MKIGFSKIDVIVWVIISACILFMLYMIMTPARAQTVSRSALVTWSAVTQDESGNTLTESVTYNLYQGAKGAIKPKVQSGISATSFIVGNLPFGETCFNVTAVTANGGESALSNEACKSFPFPKPAAPVITVQ